MPDFLMPSLGADMEAGRLVEWRVRPGDRVERGQVVAEVETDKGIIEVESWQAGTVSELLVQPGTSVPVGTPLARFDGGAETIAPPAPPPVASPASPPVAPPAPPPVASPASPPVASPAPPRASPSARRRATELGVDLAAVAGTGPDGAITLADVERGAARPVADPSAAMRRVVAAAMSRSKREIPHYYLSTQVDVGAALAWLDARNAALPIEQRLLQVVLHVRAVALACVKVPELNGHWVEGEFRRAESVHVGLAITLRGGGLVAPALRDAASKPLDVLAKETNDLILRARTGALRSSELTEPTLTLTSLGDAGVETVFPIIHPPQVAIVGIGGVRSRPWVVGASIEPRSVLTVTLAADHRASSGHSGSAFLAEVARRLAEPPQP